MSKFFKKQSPFNKNGPDSLDKIQDIVSWNCPLFFVLISSLLSYFEAGAQNPLESQKWKSYFDNRIYEKHADNLGKGNFWDFDRNYTYYTSYSLLIIYSDGSSELIQCQYDGLNNLLRKKHTLPDENFDRIENGNIAYMVFDNMLLKNTILANAVEGDFNVI
ncbi:MAG: hypothetical protein OXH57_00910 [Ekhidna sp.]|nr:hypothetical protein [Ekhidna sp.]